MKKAPTKTRRLLDRTFNEVKRNPPERVRVVERKHGKKAAEKMKVAIALSKARKMGARVPKSK